MTYKKLLIRLAGIYLLFLLTYFLILVGAMIFQPIGHLERKLNPSVFVFWQNNEFYVNPPLFSDQMTDTHGYLSSKEPENLPDINIFVFLLNGLDEIHSVPFVQQLGLDAQNIAAGDPASSLSYYNISIVARLHPIPFYLQRRSIIVLNAAHLFENYDPECLDEMVYGKMIGDRDHTLWDHCKVN